MAESLASAMAATFGVKNAGGRPQRGESASVMDTVSRLIVIMAVALAVLMGFFSRVFSVVKFESVIHEFDPHFNWRVAQTLVKDGFEAFFDWFDPYTWYPLGRIIGGTTYPGIHATSSAIYWFLNALNIPTAVREACVFTPPIFGGLSALASFLFVREVKDTRAGLIAAFFVAVNPSYISRSSAGGYDNEAVAIFAMILTFYTYVKTLKTGSLFYSVVSNMSFFFMISSWGGYNFLMNLIPLHALILLLAGRFSWKLYVAYTPFVVFGNLFAMNLPVIGFNAVRTSEHMASYFVFAVMQAYAVSSIMQRLMPKALFKEARKVFIMLAALVGTAIVAMTLLYLSASPTFGWSGRSLTLLDPTYATKYIPIIASVAEHAPPVWTHYWQDFNVIIFFVPIGLVLSFFPMTDASLFLVVYGMTSVYFSGIMVRLMLVLAPAACFLGAIGMSELITALGRSFYARAEEGEEMEEDPARASKDEGESVSVKELQTRKSEQVKSKRKETKKSRGEEAPEFAPRASKDRSAEQGGRRRQVFTVPRDASVVALAGIVFLMFFYLVNSIWMAADVYSNPSIVMMSRTPSGQPLVIDDYREAYTWLRMNSDPDAKIASWWDYGYQMSALSERTVLVDNNTWNNTHIATVGRAFCLDEESAWHEFKKLDTNYVLVLFGGLLGYTGDDMNKMIWIIRISSGEYPEIQENNYLSQGRYRIDEKASKVLLDSLMYKLSYYNFHKATAFSRAPGFDQARKQVPGREVNNLQFFEEAFTSKNWLMRIYRVLPEPKNYT